MFLHTSTPAASFAEAGNFSSDNASRKSERPFDLTIVQNVSAIVGTSTMRKYAIFSASDASASAIRFMPRKPVAMVPTRPNAVTTVSRTRVFACRRSVSLSK